MVIEPNILAFQNADLLDLIDRATEHQIATTDGLAAAAGRDPSNLRKTLKRLIEDGLINEDPLSNGLTDDGRAQLAAFKRAQHGGERRKAKGRWNIDQIRPNPANRKITAADVEGMADAIVGAGGVLLPLVLSPPDANGVRTIWAGERRWRAARLLAERRELPEEMTEGLPFVEREATPGEAALIAVIENTARKDLTPWEDARFLKQAADGLGITNASELARRIGRARDGDRGGLRDVQDKLKIANLATAEQIADYEAKGSWDDFRDQVLKRGAYSEKAAPTLSDQIADHGPAALQPKTSGPMKASDFGVPTDFMAHGRDISPEDGRARAAEWLDTTTKERLILPLHPSQRDHGYPRAQIEIARIKGSNGWVEQSGYSLGHIGHHATLDGVYSGRCEAWPERSSALAAAAERIRRSAGGNLRGGLPKDIDVWLKQVTGETPSAPTAPTGPHVVNGVDYGNATRANEARRAIGLLPPIPPANYGGGRNPDDEADVSPPTPAAPATTPAPTPAPSLGQHLQTLADQDRERKRQGLRATLEVLLDRLEPVLTLLNGDRTDGVLPIDSDEADWFQKELSEAVRWAEDALAAVGVFDPLPGEEIARKDIGSPAVPIRQSITPDHIVCLFDGRKFKSLKRHLRTRYDMSPDEYRAKWRLPADYPMVAPNYAKAREDLARQMGVRLASKGSSQ